VEKLYLAAQIPQRTNLYLKTEVYLMFLFLFPILEAEIGCKDKATFSNFQIFLKKFSNFFSKEPYRSASLLKRKSVAKVRQVFVTSKSF
jgi:hypothetical protein